MLIRCLRETSNQTTFLSRSTTEKKWVAGKKKVSADPPKIHRSLINHPATFPGRATCMGPSITQVNGDIANLLHDAARFQRDGA